MQNAGFLTGYWLFAALWTHKSIFELLLSPKNLIQTEISLCGYHVIQSISLQKFQLHFYSFLLVSSLVLDSFSGILASA